MNLLYMLPPNRYIAETQAASGVIMIPANLDLTIKADADQVLYNDIILNHFQGGLNIRRCGNRIDGNGI